jgi:PKD repeat protein
LVVVLSATASEPVRSYAWEFGDGGTSSEPQPVHTYDQVGLFTVTLRVETERGHRVSVTKRDFIRVTGVTEAGFLYWAERGSGTIQRGAREGGSKSTVIGGLIGPEDLVVVGQRLYWTDPGSGKVESSDVDGGNRRAIASDQYYPTGVAVDEARGKVYWTTLPSTPDGGLPTHTGAIKRANLDGSGAETLTSFGPQEAFAWQIVVDSAAAKLYWLSDSWAQAATGSGVEAHAAPCDGVILKAGLDARSPTILTRGLCDGTDLAVGGTEWLYWTDAEAGTVSRIRSDGTGAVAVLATGQVEAESVAADASEGRVYWVAGTSLFRANLDGSAPETIYVGLDLPEGLAFGP